MDKVTKLNELKNLLTSGAITQEEFEQLKGEILSSTVQKNQGSGMNQATKGKKSKWFVVSGILLVITASIYFFVGNRNILNSKKNDLAQYELKGNVKYFITNGWSHVDTEEIYGFNKDGLLTYSKIGDGEISSIQRDKENRITCSQKYALVGDVGEVYLDGVKSNYKYNSKGKAESITTEYSTFDKIGSITTTILKYDSKGNVVEQITKNENGELDESIRFILKYDANDSIIQKIEKSDSYESKVKYEYNDNGYKVRITNYNQDGELDTENRYKYDERGNKIEEENLYRGESKWKNKFIYDDENRLILVEEKTNKTGWKKLYEYSYDDTGNWIKRRYYDENGQVSIVTRNIIYYSEDELKSNSEFNFELEFGSKPGESDNQNSEENEEYSSNSYGEIRGRLIGGTVRMVERELGKPQYSEIATKFIENMYQMQLSLGLFDLCLGYEVYGYDDYFGYGQDLLVILDNDDKVTNIIPESEVQDVKDICCCE